MIIVKIKGGLGNQLFQYATAKNLALRLNKKVYFDLSFFDDEKYKGIFRLDRYNLGINIASQKQIEILKNKQGSNIYLRIAKKLNIRNIYNKKTHWGEKQLNSYIARERNFGYSIYLEGWFANPYYFNSIRSLLIRELIPVKLSNETLEWKVKIESSNSVSIHIRRGDYLTNKYFHNLSVLYYKNAISYFIKTIDNPNFYFFSDDMHFVKKEFKNIKNAKFVEINNKKQGLYNTVKDVEDLYLMTVCNHQIIANSSFSWWSAWLNEKDDRIIISPERWFKNHIAQQKHEQGGLIPETWIKI